MKIHFIAIGGSAMHNLALALCNKGDEVTGSDDAIFEPSKSRLDKKGILPPKMGWFTEKLSPDIDAVILGMHAKSNNPELLKAQELGLKIFSYPEFIYEQTKNKTRIVIGGSHGKTTITSMILHVLQFHKIDVDYMVGAQLEGFDTMVHLTENNKFAVLEGDEYLSSPIDLRPKFHLYKPDIAIISGIAWDHINVFPTYDFYVSQFKIFIDKITRGGVLIYNQEDLEVSKIVEEATNNVKKIPYSTPKYAIKKGVTFIETTQGELPLNIFGQHNLNNLAGAKEVCKIIGVTESDFYKAISSFKGASKRLEKIAETDNKVAYKDFAHSPSKVSATTQAVKKQYPSRKLIACLELHTYSSLTAEFLDKYQGALEYADIAIIFYSPDAIKIKKLQEVTREQIFKAFSRKDLIIYTNPEEFKDFLFSMNFENSTLLLMSSGNYGGLDFDEIKNIFTN